MWTTNLLQDNCLSKQSVNICYILEEKKEKERQKVDDFKESRIKRIDKVLCFSEII